MVRFADAPIVRVSDTRPTGGVSNNTQSYFDDKYLTAKNYKVVWCTTTPVPNDSYGTFARKKDEDLVYNQILVPVLKKYPQITVCDLNKLVRNSNSFDQWKKGNNVHFYREQEVKLLGNAVAAAILEAAAKK